MVKNFLVGNRRNIDVKFAQVPPPLGECEREIVSVGEGGQTSGLSNRIDQLVEHKYRAAGRGHVKGSPNEKI